MSIRTLSQRICACTPRTLEAARVRRLSALPTALVKPHTHCSTTRLSHPVRNETRRGISSTRTLLSILPDAENPPPKVSEAHDDELGAASKPTPLTGDAYHELADGYLSSVAEKIDELSESREDVSGEFDQGVLTITFPPTGTYVLNKQPPNHQIWLSSPVSGPKRFDWVVAGEGMHGKEGGGVGDWVYLRDGSRLSEILRKELGVSVAVGE